MSVSRRQSMVQHGHVTLSVVRQCGLLNISRPGLYYAPKGEPAVNHVLMREIDLAFTEWPFLGVRQMRNYLRLLGYSVGIKRVRRLMRLMADADLPKPPNQHPTPRTQVLSLSAA